MQLDKETVLSFLREQGQHEKARQAESELPDQVDTERDAGLLEKLGVNPRDLMSKFAGGANIPGL
ncbi:MAG: hypothetical protein ICV74_08665 [Thermoleophilia bacterium]|nr:hypothetical protein [Thermoleophilia bacterium]